MTQAILNPTETVGGSEIAAALGVSRWMSAQQLLWRKRGLVPDVPDNERMYWGRLMEPIGRRWYIEQTRSTIFVPHESIVSTDEPWMRATPDGLRTTRPQQPHAPDGWDRLLEIKSVGSHSARYWGEPGTDQIPIEYMLQVQHSMAVLDLEVADVVAMLAGDPPTIFEVRRDEEIIQTIVEGGRRFMRMLRSGQDFPIDGSEEWTRYLAQHLPMRTEEIRQCDERQAEMLEQLMQLKLEAEDVQARFDECKNLVRAEIGEAAGIEAAIGRVTWRQTKDRETVDWEGVAVHLAANHGVGVDQLAEVVSANTTTTKGSRRLLMPRNWTTKDEEE